MKTSLLILLLSINIFAQYTPDDSALVHTTFTREFNKKIVGDYLASKDSAKVIAALLSISHSNDSSFISSIVKADYNKYGNEISFALGQLGPNSLSEGYLLNKLNSNITSPALLQALGKCGGENSFEFMIQKYNESSEGKDGISIALFYYNSRGLLNKEKALPVLLKELRDKSFSKLRQADAAFTIYRANLAEGLKDVLTDEIKQVIRNYSSDDETINKLYYMIGSLRLLKYFPDDKELFYALQSIDNHIIKVEAAKALAFYNYTDKNELLSYLRFFNDANPNVTRTAAIALKDFKLNSELKEFLKVWLEEKIVKMDIPGNSQGELLISYISLFNPDYEFVMRKFRSYVFPEFSYKAAGMIKGDKALDFLTDTFSKGDYRYNRNRFQILQSLFDFQKDFAGNTKLNHVLLESLTSDFPPIVTSAAVGVDSSFIEKNKDTLSLIVTSGINKNINNPEYTDIVLSLYHIAEQVDTNLSKNLLNVLSGSEVFSIKQFASNKLKNKNNAGKDESILGSLWQNAFKYSYAELETSKGKIKIKFLPEYAPVTVGNFCSLSEKGFYNNNYFHRVVPAFVIQGGDTTLTGWSGPGYEIISECSPLDYKKGMVGMASAGKDTEGSQWFITTGYYPHLNGKYTIFAEVVEGMETVYNIDQDDKVISVKLIN